MLILFCGLPATGKTTLARKVAKRIDAAVLRTDVIRKEMFAAPKYTEEEKELVYTEMFERAEKFLLEGKAVILDANFYLKLLRERAREIAARRGEKFLIVECVLDEKKILGRIKARTKKCDESDANTIEIYRKIKKSWEPIDEQHIVIDTSCSRAEKEVIDKISGM